MSITGNIYHHNFNLIAHLNLFFWISICQHTKLIKRQGRVISYVTTYQRYLVWIKFTVWRDSGNKWVAALLGGYGFIKVGGAARKSMGEGHGWGRSTPCWEENYCLSSLSDSNILYHWYHWYSIPIGFNLKGMKVSHNSESIQIKEGVVWASQAVAINWTRFIKVAWCPLSSWWLSSHKRRWGYLEFTRSRPSFLFEYWA